MPRFLCLPLLLAVFAVAPTLAQTTSAPPTVLGGAGGALVAAAVFGPAGAKTAGTTLPFRRDPAITRQAEALTVQQVRATNEAAAEQLAQLFASREVLAAWGEALQQFSLGLDNVADALTANWLVLYLCANQQDAPASAAQVAGLRRQLRRVCALPGIGGKLKTSAQRQQLADYLHLQSLLLNQTQSGNEQSHDAQASATLAQRARQIARQNMGFDPTTVRLTDKGLVRK